MPYDFPADVAKRIQAHLATGQYATEDEVIRDAIRALEQERQDLAAIQAGLRDMQAGRYRSLQEVDVELRQKHKIPPDA